MEGHDSESEEIRALRAELVQIVLEDLRAHPDRPTLVRVDPETLATLLGDWEAKLEPLKDSLFRLEEEFANFKRASRANQPADAIPSASQIESLRREIRTLSGKIENRASEEPTPQKDRRGREDEIDPKGAEHRSSDPRVMEESSEYTFVTEDTDSARSTPWSASVLRKPHTSSYSWFQKKREEVGLLNMGCATLLVIMAIAALFLFWRLSSTRPVNDSTQFFETNQISFLNDVEPAAVPAGPNTAQAVHNGEGTGNQTWATTGNTGADQ